MRYETIANSLFIKNREKLLTKIKPNSIAIVLSNDEMPRSGDSLFPYRQNADLFYLCGINQEDTVLMLCPDFPDESLREVLFITRSNQLLETWVGHKLTKEEATKISGINKVFFIDEMENVMRDLFLHSENIYLPTNEYLKFKTPVITRDLRFIAEMKQKYPLHNYFRLTPLVTDLRIIKEAEETEMIKKAINITNSAFRRVLKFVKPNVAEYEVEAEIMHEFLKNRATGHAFMPIIASGKDACTLHYITNEKNCISGDLLLIDFGADFANYAADITRTIPVSGKFTERQRQVYQAVLNVQKEATQLLVPGNTIFEYNKAVLEIMDKQLVDLGLYTAQEAANQSAEKPLVKKYMPHNISHHLGIDVHDVGSRFLKLQKNMIFTCEPGIYIKEEGIGIRLENDILVEDKPINLSQNIPIEIEEIEELMRG